MENQAYNLIKTLWLVILDQNTTLDPEARSIICGSIAKETGLDYDDIMRLALTGEEVDFEEWVAIQASHENAMEDRANRRISYSY